MTEIVWATWSLLCVVVARFGLTTCGRRPAKLSPVEYLFVFAVHVVIRDPGPEGRPPHSRPQYVFCCGIMYFAAELYMYVAAELHFNIVAGARRALVLNGDWS